MDQTVGDRGEIVGFPSAQTDAEGGQAEIAVVYLDDRQGRSPSCLDLAAHGQPLHVPSALLVEGTRLQLSWEGELLSFRLLWCHPIGVGGPWMVGAEALGPDDDEPGQAESAAPASSQSRHPA